MTVNNFLSNPFTITASSAANINYSGTPANQKLAGCILTNITASNKPLFVFNLDATSSGNTNVFNFTTANRVDQIGVG